MESQTDDRRDIKEINEANFTEQLRDGQYRLDLTERGRPLSGQDFFKEYFFLFSMYTNSR